MHLSGTRTRASPRVAFGRRGRAGERFRSGCGAAFARKRGPSSVAGRPPRVGGNGAEGRFHRCDASCRPAVERPSGKLRGRRQGCRLLAREIWRPCSRGDARKRPSSVGAARGAAIRRQVGLRSAQSGPGPQAPASLAFLPEARGSRRRRGRAHFGTGVRPGPGGVGSVPPGHASVSATCAPDAASLFSERAAREPRRQALDSERDRIPGFRAANIVCG